MKVYLYKCKVNNIFLLVVVMWGSLEGVELERGKNKVGGNR